MAERVFISVQEDAVLARGAEGPSASHSLPHDREKNSHLVVITGTAIRFQAKDVWPDDILEAEVGRLVGARGRLRLSIESFDDHDC